MSDQSVAALARKLVEAMEVRARTRTPEDLKVVLDLQTQLAAEVRAEAMEK